MSARDCAMAMRWRAGRLSPARLARGGMGAEQAADGTGGRGAGVAGEEVAVVMSVAVGTSGVEVVAGVQEAELGAVEAGGGGGGGGTEGSGGGGGRVEERDRAADAGPRREMEWLKLGRLLWGEKDLDGCGRV